MYIGQYIFVYAGMGIRLKKFLTTVYAKSLPISL